MSFWARFEPAASCYPDQCQCEIARDAFIRQPSAFWSSFAYVFAGLLIFRYIKQKSFELKMWSGVCVLVGISSLFGHMTFTRFAMAFDFASIILVLSFFALLNLFELLKVRRMFLYFGIYYFTLFIVMYSMGKWAKIGVCILIFMFATGDVVRELGLDFFKARKLQLSLLILCASFGLFLMDEFHVQCMPDSWLQFHSLWHIGTAVAMFYYGAWRFETIRAR